jgi:hypothetical protein
MPAQSHNSDGLASWLKWLVGVLIAILAAGGGIASWIEVFNPPKNRQETFHQPTIDGYRLDWCYRPASECGAQAATYWCEKVHFTVAIDQIIDENVGQQGIQTKLLGTGTFCDGDWCDSFKSITCAK